jgi:HD-GYP domain-containing protein (c-di-GMP phosphodiesterase class II)
MVDDSDFKPRGNNGEIIEAEFREIDESPAPPKEADASPAPQPAEPDGQPARELQSNQLKAAPGGDSQAGGTKETDPEPQDAEEEEVEDEGDYYPLLDRPLKGGLLSVAFDSLDLGMATMSLEMLVSGEPAPCDIFLALYSRSKKRVEMKLICGRGQRFKALWRDRLRKAKQDKVYVPLGETRLLHDYFMRYSGAIIDNTQITRRRKISVVQEMAIFNLQLLFGSQLEQRDLTHMVERSNDTVGRMARDPQILSNLSEVLKSDYSVYAHSVNVSMMSMAFGRYINLHENRIHSLGMGGLLHDIGMSRLPRAVLDKTEPLNLDEREAIRRHPEQGYNMLLNVSAVPYDVLQIVKHHHENADGSGYPGGLTSQRTPLLARIIRVVDAYDAMTSLRPYHDAYAPFEAASNLIKSMSDQFGEDIVPRFIRFLGSPYVASG